MWYGEAGLHGREFERHRIDRIVEGLRSHVGDSLILIGETGIGKSALLRYAAARAGDARVLFAGGVPAEAALPFAGLHGLLGPVMDLLPRIPARQAAALSAAFALSPSTFVDQFALSAGTLNLLTAAAQERPLLVLVDDLQDLDGTSREALLFAARRTTVEGIGMLLATAVDEPEQDLQAGLPCHQIPRLDRATSRDLLIGGSRTPIAPAVADQLVEAAGGLPLALVDLPGVLTPAQLAGADPLRDPLPVGPAVRRAFAPRLAVFDPPVRTALLVAAAAGAAGLAPTIAAIGAMGVDAAALSAAEAAGVIRLEESGVAFCNPLLRSVVYHEAALAERRTAHRALAEVTAFVPRAWHLGTAALRPDEETADELERTVAQESGHLPVADAAQLVERAAELTGADCRRAGRWVAAAESWQRAGAGERARELLEAAVHLTDDLRVRGQAQLVLAREELRTGRPAQAHRQLARESARVRGAAPSVAAVMLLDAAGACRLSGETSPALVAVRRARLLAGQAGPLSGALVAEHAGVLAVCGHLTEARALLDERRTELEKEVLSGGAPAGWRRSLWTGLPGLLARLGDLDTALLVVEELISQSRLLEVAGLLPGLLVTRAELHLRTGDWDTAEAGAVEAVTVADRVGQPPDVAAAEICLARLAAIRGRRAECDACLAHARETCQGRLGGLAVPIDAAEGLLELGEGDHEAAFARLEGIVRQVETGRAPDPGAVPWVPDFVEAAVRVSRPDEARRVLATVAPHAAGSPSVSAQVARSRGLLSADPDPGVAEEWFGAALRLDRCGAEPFERARDELCLGEWLRRQGRAADATRQLRAARATFEEMGAAPWAMRAGRELAALGEEPSGTPTASPATSGPLDPVDPPPLQCLTEQERRVTMLVGQGATNREAAGALFLSTKTIEFHLRSVYRKLGVRSRAELAHLIGAGDFPSATR